MSSAVESLQLYRRAADYIAAGMMRGRGDWGPVPGINLIHGALNRMILDTGASVLLVSGRAVPANQWLDGSLADALPEFSRDRDGLTRLLRSRPAAPGTIHGGLGTAYGAALDNPGVVVACIVSGEEAETAPWHAHRQVESGTVTAILHLNGDAGYGALSDAELTQVFTGFGWRPVVATEDDLPAALAQGGLVILRTPAAGAPGDLDAEGLFDADGAPVPALLAACPAGGQRIGANAPVREPLTLPDIGAHGVSTDERASATDVLDGYLAAVSGTFRSVPPSWMPGYVMTGRHSVGHDAPVELIDAHARFLAAAAPWRAPIAGLNYVVREHGPVGALLQHPEQLSRIYLPADANTLLVTMDKCLRATDVINLVVTAERPLPQWLSLDDAKEHVSRGATRWEFASNDDGEPDIVLAACGATATVELLAATSLLRVQAPELRVRFVNVNDLYALASSAHHPSGLSQSQFTKVFTKDRPVLLHFGGHPSAIHQLIHRRPQQTRFHVRGITDESANTTPFDRLAINGVDRYQLAIEALTRADILAAEMLPGMSGEFAVRAVAGAEKAINTLREQLERVRAEIRESGDDPPEITGWTWAATNGHHTLPETPGPVM